MKLILLFICTLFSTILLSQEIEKEKKYSFIDFQYFYGSIIEHNPDIAHLITGHPEGFIVSYNNKTYGFNEWERYYNYPDWGFSLIYQNMKNEALGENVSIYGHYSFYFLKRRLQFRIGQGIAFTSNPFDIETNFKNNAYGTTLLSTTYVMFNYSQQNIFKRFGLQAGISLIHYSNANIKAPNTSTNTFAFNVGFSYDMYSEDFPEYIVKEEGKKFGEPIAFNAVIRSGFNESDVVGIGQFPFVVVSGYADKRVSRISSFQVGFDVFFSRFLKQEIEYQFISFPNSGLSGDEDWKRAGLFIGHELHFGRISAVTQLGYYVYYPYDFEGRTYFRAGLKRYFGKKYFGSITLKSHAAKAEAIEFGIGIRFR